MADSDRLARLRAIPLFAELDDAAIERLAEIGTELEVPAGMVLIERDQPASGMFVLEEGTLTVQLHGRTVEIGPGEFVGELSLLIDGAHRAARVQAKTPVRLLAIGRAEFEQLLAEDPLIAVAMLPVLARRLHEMIESG
jgi:CRP-like cAMP-binding protein